MDLRRDSLAAAADAVLAVEKIGQMGEPRGRSSCTWIENVPNVRGTVAETTRLHCDIRHENLARLDEMERTLRDLFHDIVARRLVSIDIDPYATFGPVQFDARLGDLLRRKARERRLATRNMVAAAGHDSALLAAMYPSAILFVPSIAGITHNPKESSSPDHLANGAQVLLDTVLELAGRA
jgi:N-carbamoyl-L-amino-acid hydrolase